MGRIAAPGVQQKAKTWTNFANPLGRKGAEEALLREQIIHAAYQCIISIGIRELLLTTFDNRVGSRLWRVLGFIAGSVSNISLLMLIVSFLPHFRKVKICPCPPKPKTKLNPKYLPPK